jgi:pilus assembly protein CpaE
MLEMVDHPGGSAPEGRQRTPPGAAAPISWRMPGQRSPSDLLAVDAGVADPATFGLTSLPAPPPAPPPGPVHLEPALDGSEDQRTGRVITVLCPKGGVGRTTVATNLAIGLANVAPGEVVVVDLDLQFGDVATAMQLAPSYTFSHTRAQVPPDGASVKACLTSHPGNLFALCAPLTPVEAEDLAPALTKSVLAVLARSFPYVVVDTAPGLDEHTLNAIDVSTDLVVISATDVAAIRNTMKQLDVLGVITSQRQRTHLVLNRADARTGLHQTAIEAVLGMDINTQIPSSGTVPLALNQGTPILETDPTSPVSRAIVKLVWSLVPAEQIGKPDKRGRRRTPERRAS